MDIENIIYLLFVVISLISGIWKNSSKQKEEKKRRAAMEESLAMDEEPEATSWKPEMVKPADPEQESAATQRLAEMKRAAEKASVDRRLRKRNLLEEEDRIRRNQKPSELASLMKDFDAKKAIIYSEIINPPYI